MAQVIPILHIAGCGRAARVLARLWADAGTFEIGQVMNRSRESAAGAVEFIGQGQAVAELDHRITGGWLLVGLPDSALEAFALELAGRMPGQLELSFHLSGSIGAQVLAPLGCPCASVHPVRPFASPQRSLTRFAGTWCLGEGVAPVLDRLLPAFAAIGARTGRLPVADKRLYHAATVAAANFLVTLNRLAVDLAGHAGLEQEMARALVCDLQTAALENIRSEGPRGALTGPIERADPATCRGLLEAVSTGAPDQSQLFRDLALATVSLARARRPDADWDAVEAAFK